MSTPLIFVTPAAKHAVLLILLSICLLSACARTTQNLTRSGAALDQAIAWYTGEAGTVDDGKARQLLESVQDAGNPLARMWLARVYSTGRMTFPADKTHAIVLAESVINELEPMAGQGIPEATFLMGTAWGEGLGKPVDAVQAARWYRRAANQGHTLGAHNLGNAYAGGIGVVRNPEEARHWWLLAAAKGDAIAQLSLARYFEQGEGGDRDMALARFWYTRAAGRGNPDARAALLRLSVL